MACNLRGWDCFLFPFFSFELFHFIYWTFPGGSDGKESACSAGNMGLIPESGRLPGDRNDYPLQYSCLEKPMDREPGRVQSVQSVTVGHD